MEKHCVYVDLFGVGLPALVARTSAKCEAFNDLSGDLAMLLRHAALHAEALEAAARDECRDDDTELSRCLRLFRAAEPNLRGDSFREKLDALRERLSRVYIEKLPPVEIVAFFDSSETLFFAPESVFPRSPLEALALRSALERAKGRVVSPGETAENCIPLGTSLSFRHQASCAEQLLRFLPAAKTKCIA